MPLKKASLTTAYNGLQCCIGSQNASYSTSTSPTALPIPRARPESSEHKKRRLIASNIRRYATVKESKSYDFRDNMNWPCRDRPPATESSIPSPYDIFEIERDGVYTKHRFYELVKMYHPDRHNHISAGSTDPIAGVPPMERIERYRLVIQAHDILSDPVKRRAYNATGAGWGSRATTTFSSSQPSTSAASSANWNGDSPYANATWEDWERWYQRTSPQGSRSRSGPQGQAYAGTYVKSNMFASFVIMMAIISGVAQATHAANQGGSIEDRAQAFTAKTHAFMSERKVENAKYQDGGNGSHNFGSTEVDQRIRHFLERRDPYRYGLKDEEEETYRKHFAKQNGLPAPKPLRNQQVVEAEVRTT